MDGVSCRINTNGNPCKTLYIILISLNIVYGGLPISYPGTLNKNTGGKTLAYNLIDVYPSCWEKGICPMFPPGSELAAFPNSEEKVQMLFHNMFRMFANCTLTTKWGKWRFGANTNGGLNYFCPNCKYCGDGKPDKGPLYWYSDANQMARFKQYDEKACDQEWYNEPKITAHYTCDWVLPEYGGGSHCDLFGGCPFGYRAAQFCEEDRCWFESEGICGGNSCYFDAHCEPIFAAKYDYQGAGFVEGTNGVDTVYSRFTKEIFYILPMGAHFDERTKVAQAERRSDGKYFTLMVEYFDHNKTQFPYKCWSLYDGHAYEMEVALSWNLLNGTQCGYGYSSDSHSVLYMSNHLPPENTCQPYSFICLTTEGNFFRLPENGNYYFGTEWIDWKWSNYEQNWNLKCHENHYYYNGQQWVVNGGPELNKCDIWYYNNVNYSQCIGCDKIAKLDCISECIYSYSLDNCNCNNIIGQNLGNEWCTPSPTRNPLTSSRTYAPTPSPTSTPTLPTTARPTRSPVRRPTRSPTHPTKSPTYKPTISPTPSPTNQPTYPTISPSKSPLREGKTHSPTRKPSNNPLRPGYTHSPTIVMGIDMNNNKNNSKGNMSAGTIAAIIIAILIFIICIISWIYFRIHTNKPLYPTKSDLVLPGYGIKNTLNNNNNNTQMSRQLSNNDKMRRTQSIQAQDESDDNMDEGDGHYVTAKALPPVNKPPPIPNKGLRLDVNNINDRNDIVNESTPLSVGNDEYLSIEAARELTGVTDKEKYLNDMDFKSVFEMDKKAFDALPQWKQKKVKKDKGFF